MLFCTQVGNRLYAHVIISQILYDSPYNEIITQYPYSDGEFIELYNTGAEDVSLEGWQLCGGGKTERYVFPTNTIISAGGYLAVAFHYNYQEGDFHLQQYSSQYGCSNLYQVQEQHILILSNTGELLSLRNTENLIVDSIRYKKHKSATNADSIPYMESWSLHRKYIYVNAETIVGSTMNDWVAGPVSFGCDIPIEKCSIDEEYYHYSQQISSNRNYRIIVQPLDETMSINIDKGNVSITENARAKITYTYYDGLGRAEENVFRKLSPTGKDLADFTTYNAMGKVSRHWLPAPIEAEGYITSSTLTAAISSYYQDDMPYSHTDYENSPIGRPIGATMAGSTYYTHPNSISYQTNNANEIIRFSVTASGLSKDSYYPAGTLYKTVKKDADGKQLIEYTDLQGRLIMQQRGSANSTYYVYDEYGRLCYVVPAPLIDRLGFGITHDDDTSVQQYAYVYRYDSHNNLICKQLPGCDPIWMVYDAADKIILSQDGNQRKKGGYWSYFAYDQLGRIVYTSEIYLPNLNQPDLIAKFEDVIATETTTTDNFGYTNSYFGSATAKLLMINYYDNYDFLQLLPKNMAQTLMYQEYIGYGIQYSNTRNLLTGQRIYNLEENSYRITAMYYDIYGNVIQNRSSANLSEFYHQYIAYNFDGTKKQTLDEWDDMTEHYEYIYDHAGRLIKTLYRLNDAPTIVLNVNGYDQVGNQIAKARHNGSDKEHFNYDMRGQLTYIASGDFIEHLYYADNIPEGSNSVYNGNIAATTVIQGGQVLNFCYRYDQQNWLTHSMLYANDTTIGSEHFEYDPLGNITCLTRYNKGIKIDELSMQYNGNQLSKIQDNVENSDLYDVKEYVATSNDIGILYDANGNLTTDGDRKITEIKYNLLNLPDTIIFTNGNTITYQYDAIGTKLKTSYLTLLEPILTKIVETPTLQTHYSLVHRTEIWHDRNRQKQCVLGSDSVWRWEKEIVYNEEGYTEFILNDTTIISTDVYYFRKDHLGSNVAVWNATTNKTPQRTFYYASGLPMSISIGDDLQKHKYNGKEFETINGLNEYDSHARRYYPAICRTTTIDPLCEKFYNLSPYSWCGNNYVNAIDPNGEIWCYYPYKPDIEDVRQEYFWVDDEEFNHLKEENPEIQGASAIVVFEGSRNEKFGSIDGKGRYIGGDGAVLAKVTLYGPQGADDITADLVGFTMTSDYDKYGAIDNGFWPANYDEYGMSSSKLDSHWVLNKRGLIPTYDYRPNESPYAGELYGTMYKNGIFIHSTVKSNNLVGNKTSTGCLLLDWRSMQVFNKHMQGVRNFEVHIIRK